MKTFNKYNGMTQVTRVFVAAGVMALVATMITACGNKGSSNSDPAPVVVTNPNTTNNGYYPSCASGCGSNTGFLASAYGQVISYSLGGAVEADMALDFFGDQSMVAAMSQTTNGYVGSGSYQGQVIAQGMFRMNVASALCGVPAGTYTLQASQPGIWSGMSFGNLTLVGTGPTQIYIQLPSNFISPSVSPATGPDGRQYPYRVQNTIWVQGQNTGNFYQQPCQFVLQ